jgi:phosphohistidine phosphatase SixA
MSFERFLLAACVLMAVVPPAAAQAPLQAVTVSSPEGRRLVELLQRGGLVLFFRHADTTGMPCDRSFRVGDRDGQRNLSEEGRRQSAQIGAALREYGIPVRRPVLAGPVFRARDTAELAFGAADVEVTDGLLADDYAGERLAWVLDEHRRLFRTAPGAGTNQVLVGHRTPAIMVLGPTVGGEAFPEGAALVISPSGRIPRVLGILALAPLPGRGFHGC